MPDKRLKKFVKILDDVIHRQHFQDIRVNLETCIEKNESEEGKCKESEAFFASLRNNLLVRKLLSHSSEKKLSIAGVGGFSFVLRIPKHIVSERDVSLKVSDGKSKLAKNEIRVFNEIRLLKLWKERKSRGIIRALHAGISKPHNICYILMPNYDASLVDLILVPSLQPLLPQQPISENMVLITTQLMNAVQFMRHNAMAHRDIKLDNILVRLNLKELSVTKVVLSDFGDSCIKNENSHILCGTQYYIAPELFYEAALGIGKRNETLYTMQMMQHADVFSLGQSILLLLTRNAQRKNTIRPAQGYINERNAHRSDELKMSGGMFLTDITCTTDPRNLFTETISNWGCMNPNERKKYALDQKDETQQMLDSLVSMVHMSQFSKPVFEFKLNKLSMENIRDRYDRWKETQGNSQT